MERVPRASSLAALGSTLGTLFEKAIGWRLAEANAIVGDGDSFRLFIVVEIVHLAEGLEALLAVGVLVSVCCVSVKRYQTNYNSHCLVVV